jgi:hypothetical protein
VGAQRGSAEALYRKGEICLRRQLAGALDFLQAAARLCRRIDYQSAYGWALHRKSPDSGGLASISKAIALRSDNAEAHKRLAWC